MTAEIISVGTELLLGQILNSDAQYLSQQLSAMGIDVYYQGTVGDNMARAVSTLKQAFDRSDIVIATGGLGPTLDDMTKEAIAKCLGREMIRDEASARWLDEHFARRGYPMTPNNYRQADFPKDSIILPNAHGTAPGCIVEEGGKCFIVLPGPPHECKGMFEDHVRAYLSGRSGARIVSKVLRVFGMGESAAAHALRDLIEAQTNPTIAPYASIGEMSLRLSVKCGENDDAEALLAPLEREVRARLGDVIYSTGDETLEQAAAHALMCANMTISTAESCTGGMVASMLISVPGISRSFLEGFIPYANEAKLRSLGVSADILRDFGAVSAQTAAAMARGAREATHSDIALSTTGIAGPDGGSDDKPVGLVYIALAHSGGETVKELCLSGSRDRIRRMSAMNALDLVRRFCTAHGGV